MASNTGEKPAIIVVALALDPSRGSEPGKGWWWSCALSKHFRLHLITEKKSEEMCRNLPIVVRDGWTFHSISRENSTWSFPRGYMQYHGCLKEALATARQVIAQNSIQGLCHITLGSFRLLPRYDLLNVPYTIGPVGGGERSPFQINLERPAPLTHKATEGLRPILNNSFALIPHLRACMKSARVVLSTSEETSAVVERMGAKKTAVVFPDAYESPLDVETIRGMRSSQLDLVRQGIRLLWQGRSLWWKGPDLALMILRRALDEGVNVKLTMVSSSWESDFGRGVRRLAGRMGLDSHLEFVENMPRAAFLKMIQDYHGMIAPSLHDSGGIPLVEAQALGLPCFTLGLGGHKMAACPGIGVNMTPGHVDEFVRHAVERLKVWQQSPEKWLEEVLKGAAFSRQFTIDKLADEVERWIVPAFK